MLGYQAIGHGSHPVLALHGWFGDHTTFAPLLDALDTDAFRWILPAYRGYGLSRHLDGAYTVEEIAADCAELAVALGLERFSLVGHSMGCKVIQRILADAPRRVRRLVAVAGVPASGMGFDARTRRLFAEAAHSAEGRRAIVDHSTGGRLEPAYVDRVVAHSVRTSRVEAFAGYLPSWADGDFHEQVDGIPTPVKVIVGEHDPEMNADLMRATWLRWYPNAELEVLGAAGHYLPDETPVALATSIQAFLRADGGG